MRQRVNLDVALHFIVRPRARQRIAAIDVHGARSANAFSTRTAERQGRVDLVHNLDQRVEHHRPATVHIEFVGIDARVVVLVWIVAVDRKRPRIARTLGRRKVLALRKARVFRKSEFSHSQETLLVR